MVEIPSLMTVVNTLIFYGESKIGGKEEGKKGEGGFIDKVSETEGSYHEGLGGGGWWEEKSDKEEEKDGDEGRRELVSKVEKRSNWRGIRRKEIGIKIVW